MSKTAIIYALSLGLLVVSGARPCWACSCKYPDPQLEAAEQADTVFVAKVVKLTPLTPDSSFITRLFRRWFLQAPHDGYRLHSIIVEFEVLRKFKGTGKSDSKLESSLSSASCGYTSFQAGHEFLVYAWRDDAGGLSTGLFSRTAPVAGAEAEIEELEGHYGRNGS